MAPGPRRVGSGRAPLLLWLLIFWAGVRSPLLLSTICDSM